MSVGFNVDKAASQEMSVALNQGAILNGTDLVSKDKETDKLIRTKSAREMTATEIMDKAKSGNNKFTTEVLKPFFSKLAEVGITVGPERQAQRAKDELAKIFGDGESFEDLVEIKSRPDYIKQIGKAGQQNHDGSGSAFSNQSSQEEVMALMQELSGALTEFAANQTPALAQQIKELKEKLLSKGVSDAKLKSLELETKAGARTDAKEMVKQAMILQMLSSESKIERTVYGRGLQDLIAQLDPNEAKDIVQKARFEAKQEVQSFTQQELENLLIKHTHLQDGEMEDIFKIIELGEKVSVNCVDWLENVWEKNKEHYGLKFFDAPPSVTGQNVDTNSEQQQQQQQKHGYEFEAKDEQEILVNRLRAQYMQQALKGDAMTFLTTEFKIRKLKNGLIKLGIFTKDLEEKVRHEAEIVAKIKIIEMLKEALVERASFYELAGPAFLLVEKKIKGLLKNAERLGMPISGTEFINLRDKANRKVFDLSIKELGDVRSQLASKYSAKLEKKETLLIRLLSRLKEESTIEIAIPSAC